MPRIGIALLCWALVSTPVAAQTSPYGTAYRALPAADSAADPRSAPDACPAPPAAPRSTAAGQGTPIPIPPPASRTPAAPAVRTSPTSVALVVGSSLATVLGLFFLFVWLARRAYPKASVTLPSDVLEVLGRVPLASRHHLQLIRLGRRLVLVSVTAEHAETLSEITDPDEVNQLCGLCRQQQPHSVSDSFRQVLQQLGTSNPTSWPAADRDFAALSAAGRRPRARNLDSATPTRTAAMSARTPAPAAAWTPRRRRLRRVHGGRLGALAAGLIAVACTAAVVGGPLQAQDLTPDRPAGVTDFLGGGPELWTSPQGLSSALQIVLLLTVLSLAPAVLLMTTSFVRMVVVLGLLRQALGTQQLPPSQVITSLALFLTLLIMAPVWKAVYDDAIVPYTHPRSLMTLEEAWERGSLPIKRFMARQIDAAGNTQDLHLFYRYLPADTPAPETFDDVPLTVLLPAYLVSELKIAFLIGFQLYLPFLILDIVVASVTISMGMLMLPPVMISLPLKLILFVLVDGWRLVVGMLLESFGTPY